MSVTNIGSRDFHLTDALHCEPATIQKGALRKGLREYRVFLLVLAEAVKYLQAGELQKFDALVGENACQIRAVRVAVIATQKLVNCEDLAHCVDTALSSIDSLLTSKQLDILVRGDTSMEAVLKEHNLHILLSEEGMFIFLSYILSEMKEQRPSEENLISLTIKDKTVSKNFKKFDSAISSRFADQTASKCKRLLATESVRWVQRNALQLEDASTALMLFGDFQKQHNTWPCTPMFWTYKVLLEVARRQALPAAIVVDRVILEETQYRIIDREVFVFTSDGNDGDYVVSSSNQINESQPVLIIKGLVCTEPLANKEEWRRNLLQWSLKDIVLAGAADHPQYPGDETALPVDDAEYQWYGCLAKEVGFSLKKPSLFFINHVYVNSLSRELTSK